MMKLLFFMLNRWRKRFLLIKIRKKLGLEDLDMLKMIGAKRRIWKAFQEYMRCKKIKLRVALRLQSNYRMIVAQNKAYTQFLGLQVPKQIRSKSKRRLFRGATVEKLSPFVKSKLSR